MNDCRTTNERRGMRRLLLGAMALLFALVLCPMLAAHAEAQTVEVGIPVEEHPELFHTRSMPTHGEGKIAVFLIQFPDQMNDNPEATRENYEKLYFSGGVDTAWGATTVAKFYEEQSYGKLKLSGQVFDWYTAKHERSYYDSLEKKAELIVEAAEHYRAKGINFSNFDGDGDGVIDAIVYHFAGESSANRDDPWYSGLEYSGGAEGFGEIGDVRFTTMVQVHEDFEDDSTCKLIGTACHELMHTLGMPDLYGEVQAGMSPGIDLMVLNSKAINPYTKLLLGWFDTVDVITDSTKGVRLDVYGYESAGDVAIITDEYNGLYDEFYLVAYREYEPFTNVFTATPTVWHVDARLNEEGTAFLYQNLYYEARPDKDNAHNTGYASEHLFLEELSANPDYNFIFDIIQTPDNTAFGEDSVLGPNSLPSSDTHDGDYTGIQIQNFTEYNEEYLTFDVSFVSDTTPPKVMTKEDELPLREKVTVCFNEFIYAGNRVDGIRVTDLEGNPLDVTIVLTHYPRNEIEIVFKDASYEKGYKILLPADCVRDAAGNSLEEITLTANADRPFFPYDTVKLPNVGEYKRANDKAYFFPREDGLVVITGCWANHVSDAKVEFMRLDFEGNVLTQTVVDNPFSPGRIENVAETGDGHYIFLCTDANKRNANVLFCLDSEGNVKWINDRYENTESLFFQQMAIKRADGVRILFSDEVGPDKGTGMIQIDSETGEIQKLDVEINFNSLFDLSNGMALGETAKRVDGDYHTCLQILSTETFEVLAEGALVNESGYFLVEKARAHGDGTISIYGIFYGESNKKMILLLDVSLNVIKSIELPYGDGTEVVWLDNDGFIVYTRTGGWWHENAPYKIQRYDRCMNLLWEIDASVNFLYCFRSTEREILAYRSISVPERECYVDFYGSEEKYKTAHVHDLTHVATVKATCTSEGFGEYWYCAECGCWFSDEGETLILDAKTLILPMLEHEVEIIPEQAPTCTKRGVTEGTRCASCGTRLSPQKSIPATGEHVYGEWTVKKAATCAKAGEEMRQCTTCDKKETRTVAATGDHTYGAWTVVTAATCVAEGEESRACTCGKTETRAVAPTGVHVYGEWTVVTAATCGKAGEETRQCACGKSESRAIPATGEHAYGEWLVSREATRDAEGEEIRTCGDCGEKESRLTDKLPAPDVPVTLIAVIGGAVLIGALVILLLVRKRKRS